MFLLNMSETSFTAGSMLETIGIWVAIVIGIGGFSFQVWVGIQTNRMNWLLELIRKFESVEIKYARGKAAEWLSIPASERPNDCKEVSALLNFIEDLAFFQQKRAIPASDIWYHFYSPLGIYWEALRENYVLHKRQKRSSSWKDAELLMNRLKKIERKKNTQQTPKNELENFLKIEMDRFLDNRRR